MENKIRQKEIARLKEIIKKVKGKRKKEKTTTVTTRKTKKNFHQKRKHD